MRRKGIRSALELILDGACNDGDQGALGHQVTVVLLLVQVRYEFLFEPTFTVKVEVLGPTVEDSVAKRPYHPFNPFRGHAALFVF